MRRFRRGRRTNRRRSGSRRRFSGRSNVRRRISRVAASRRYTPPEIKHVEVTQGAFQTVLQTNNWSTAAISPSQLNQGVDASSVIGQEIKMRYLLINMIWAGALAADTNKANPDSPVRVIFWTPINDYNAASTYIKGLTDTDTFFDYNQIAIVRDFKMVLGNITNAGGSNFSKMIKFKIPWPRNARMRFGATGTAQLDEQKCILFMAFKSELNDCHYKYTTRMTFTDC